jgi:flagella basal body P-ring formation protein FlgA
MRCSRRSTTWCASALAAAILLGQGIAAAHDAKAAAEPAVEGAVRAAIEAAVSARVGADVTVRVDELRIHGPVPAEGLLAAAESSARAGRPAVFSLSAGAGTSRRRVGSAVAVVRLSGISLRAARPLARGESIRDADVTAVDGDLGLVPLRALPSREALVGAKAARDIAAGDPLTDVAVRAVPLVQSGDEVIVRARIGDVEAEGRAIASQDGGAGAIIQVVNPETRRLLKGRVTGRGEVEVIHEAK